MIHQQQLDLRKALAERYIQYTSTDDIPVVVTFIPSLVNYIHTAWATSHDNTYKRLTGDWKEWEVVIWVNKLNMRKHSNAVCVLVRPWSNSDA